jgi:hypothetical protein
VSDTFAAGDWAVRVREGPINPDCSFPPLALNRPVLVANVHASRWGAGTIQVLVLAGYPVWGRDGAPAGWVADYFRKVPPPELVDEPRRADATRESEPA